MAEKTRYPQIPSTVWWGVRAILKRTPNATLDERLLGVQLGVQEAAARAYIVELQSVGLLTDEGRFTALAQKWRIDDTYAEAVSEIMSAVYPESLLTVAPPGDADRQKIVNWFLREGLGQGAAGNKAATYLLISSPTANDAPSGTAKGGKDVGGTAPTKRTPRQSKPLAHDNEHKGSTAPARNRSTEAFPLNINVQIHISADAGSEQIESIFSAMKRYLYDAPNT